MKSWPLLKNWEFLGPNHSPFEYCFLKRLFLGGLFLFIPLRFFKNPRCDQQFSLLAPFISLWMGLENLMLSLSNTLYMWMIVFPHASLVCLIFMGKATCLIPRRNRSERLKMICPFKTRLSANLCTLFPLKGRWSKFPKRHIKLT